MAFRVPALLASALFAAALGGAPPVLDFGNTLVPRAQWTDELGQTHVRYQHRFFGLRVWGSELVDHSGPGAAGPTLALAVPTLTPRIRAFLASTPPAGGEPVLYPEYVLVPAGPGGDALQFDYDLVGVRPALYFPAQANPDEPEEPAWNVVLDADTSEVLEATPADLADTPALGTGNSLFSGKVTLNTTALAGGGFALKDLTRGTGGTLGANGVADAAYTAGNAHPLAQSAVDTWGNGLPDTGDGTPEQTTAVDLAYGIQNAWDYFKRIHGRQGPDGKGTSVRGIVHVGSGTDNAVWSTLTHDIKVYRPRYVRPITWPAVLAHEFTHGVTHFTAGLKYQGESGGLDEAVSDIFGVMADAWLHNGSGATIGDARTDWTVPAYFQDGTRITLRDFIKPSSVLGGISPDAWGPGLAGLDVHNSSGPMNRAFYFLSAGSSSKPGDLAYSSYLPGGMAGLGNDQAAAILYRALTTYLTPGSLYRDARDAAGWAAEDLFGAGSAQVQAVANAFAAINVGTPAAPVAAVAPVATATVQTGQLTLALPSPPAGTTAAVFKVDLQPVGRATQAPFQLTFEAGRTFANGFHTLDIDTFSAAGQTATGSASFTLANPLEQILANPGFEAGAWGWTGAKNTLVQLDATGAQAHGGSRWLAFGLDPGQPLQEVAQQETIPAGSVYANLSFWVRIRSNAATAQDSLEVTATPSGGVPVTLATLDNTGPKAVWLPQYFDLSALAGQDVTLAFRSSVTPGNGTEFDLDDVTLVVSDTAQTQVTVSPAELDLWAAVPGAAAFSAQVSGSGNTAVTWSAVGGGSIDAGGNYLAPAVPGIYSVQAKSVADPGAVGVAPVRVKPAVTLSPANATVTAGQTLTLALAAAPGVTPLLTLAGGPDPGTATLQGGGAQVQFIAPPVAGTYTLTAQDPVSGWQSQATLTVTGGTLTVLLDPAQATLAAGASLQFTALVQGLPSNAVLWSIQEGPQGGAMSQPGLYSAPLAPGTYHVVATSTQDPSRSAVAVVTVPGLPNTPPVPTPPVPPPPVPPPPVPTPPVPTLAIMPPQATLLTGASLTFQASVPDFASQAVLWSLAPGGAGGAVSEGGTFTAPAAPGTCTLVASGGGLSAQAVVTIKTTDFDGDGQVALDWADLAILADGWGASPLVTACDLNGDGVVDDADVALFFPRFGGQP